VVQSVVAQVVADVAQLEEGPEERRGQRIIETHHSSHCVVARGDPYLEAYLRVVWQHVVDSMCEEVNIACESTVGKIIF
jgi:precorrin-6B methylase 1